MMAKAIVIIPHLKDNKVEIESRPLVLCENCKWNSGTPARPYCQLYSTGHDKAWFCASGEEK